MNNNEPLVLGKIKKGKTGKPLVVLIVFLFAGAIILFLPTISKYFGSQNIIDLIKDGKIVDFFINHDKYIDDNQTNESTTTTKAKTDTNEPKLINSKTILEYNNFTLSNFNLTTDSITYKITSSNSINFDDSNYYLILKKDNKEITTIKLTGELNKELTNVFKFKTSLTDTVEVKGYIKTISDKDYPNFSLPSDETGTSSLICTKDSDTYEYMFNNNLLATIKQTYIYSYDDNSDYYKKYQEYSLIMNEININSGISSIEENYEGFIFKTEIDLNNYKEKINYNYYSLNTKSNKINFEMKAKGYDCK